MHGATPRSLRVQVHDEELGKKDDDRKSATLPLSTPRWNSAVPRFRKRRWLALILALGFAYIFIANIPTDLGPVALRVDRRVPGRTVNGTPLRNPYPPSPPPHAGRPPPGPPPGPPPEEPPTIAKTPKPAPPPKKPGEPDVPPQSDNEDAGSQHSFNGEVQFPLLDSSLQAQSYMYRYGAPTSVIFVASNLHSATLLIPMMCEMAKTSRNVVNFAYFGRDDLTIDEIQEINGAQGGCNAAWHDARPTNSIYSSDERFKKAIETAIGIMNIYFFPEVFFHADTAYEEPQLLGSVKTIAEKAQKSVIEVPSDSTDRLMWLTRLDATSLAAWRHLDVSIIIQVTKDDIGTLPRLLRSILRADYIGHRRPHVTLEIPASMESQSQKIIDSFPWPSSNENGDRKSGVSIRKHISHQRMTPLESSIQTIEAFYPSKPDHEHVMILSSNVELSSMWYHYLVFNILEYAYSLRSMTFTEPGNLVGISLITPLFQNDQEQPLKPPHWSPPKSWDPDLKQPTMEFPEAVPFMWQAPDATATLYFGHKWKELHSFLSLRLQSENTPTLRKLSPTTAPFLEPLNELMELRGWHVLYPNLPAHHVATYEPKSVIREEFILNSDGSRIEKPDGKDTDPYEAVDYDPKDKPSLDADETKVLASTPIHNIIPNNGLLPELSLLPVLDNAGELTTITELQEDGHGKCVLFRIQNGGCRPGISASINPLTAEDLFCDESGLPYSGAVEQDPYDQTRNWERARNSVAFDEEKWKSEALGDATTIEGADDEEKQKQVQKEFLEHIQRQRSGNAPDTNTQKATTKSEDSDPLEIKKDPDPGSSPEKAPGW